MKSQKYFKKGVRVGIGALFFVNFGNQLHFRVFKNEAQIKQQHQNWKMCKNIGRKLEVLNQMKSC